MPIFLGTTGHRPNKIGGYQPNNLARALRIQFRSILKHIKTLTNDQLFLNSGMALGWDTYAVTAAYAEFIPFRAIIPFKGQERFWPEHSKRIYQNILTYANEVVCCSTENLTESDNLDYRKATRLLFERDQRIIDDSDAMIACWNGSKGGTSHTVGLTYKSAKPLLVINPENVKQGIFLSNQEIEKWFYSIKK